MSSPLYFKQEVLQPRWASNIRLVGQYYFGVGNDIKHWEGNISFAFQAGGVATKVGFQYKPGINLENLGCPNTRHDSYHAHAHLFPGHLLPLQGFKAFKAMWPQITINSIFVLIIISRCWFKLLMECIRVSMVFQYCPNSDISDHIQSSPICLWRGKAWLKLKILNVVKLERNNWRKKWYGNWQPLINYQFNSSWYRACSKKTTGADNLNINIFIL